MSSNQIYGRHAASLPSLDGGGEQAARVLPGRRERRKAETREKLFRAAMRLFADRGFFETTTENITAAADVGEGTFFNYFPSKQHILTMLSEKQIEKVVTAQREAETGKVSIRQVLQHLMRAIAQEPGRTPALTRSLFTAFISNDEVRELVRNNMARGRGYIAKIIAAGQRRGEVRPERDVAALAMAFQRNVLGALLLWSMQPKDDLEVWLEETFKDFWAAAENRARSKSNESYRRSSKTTKSPRGKKA